MSAPLAQYVALLMIWSLHTWYRDHQTVFWQLEYKLEKNEREINFTSQFPRIGCELGLADPQDVEPEIIERFYPSFDLEKPAPSY